MVAKGTACKTLCHTPPLAPLVIVMVVVEVICHYYFYADSCNIYLRGGESFLRS